MFRAGKRLLPWILAICFWVAPGASRAEEAERQLRWEDLVSRIESQPALLEGSFIVEEAAGAVAQARQLPNPSVEGTLAQGRARDAGGDSRLEWGAAVSVPLGWLARRGPAVDAAEAAAAEARYRWAGRRLELLNDLRSLFYGLVHDQERVASMETVTGHASELVRLVRLRVEKGEARPAELVRAEAELGRVQNELDRSRSELEARRDRLRLLIPELGDGSIHAVGELEAVPPPAGLEAAIERMRARAPSVLAARARVRAAEAELSGERRERIPDLSARGFTDVELDRRAVGGSVELELPLFSWNGGGVRRAEAALRAAEAAGEASLRETLASVAEAHRRCENERAIADRYQTEIVPRAERVLGALEKGFQVGETTLLDVIDARRVSEETRREALESRLSAKLACERVAALLAEDVR